MPASPATPDTVELRRHLSRFLVVGVVSVGIDSLVYAGLLHAGLATTPAKGISYLLGMAAGFVGNKYWTFGSRRRTLDEPVTYVLLYAVTLLVNMTCNAGALHLLTGHLPLPYIKPGAFLIATGVTTVLNYLGMRFITFHRGIIEARTTKTLNLEP